MNNNNPLIIRNTITNEDIFKSLPIDNEITFDGGMMITETDTKGIIVYANRKFLEMTGFTKKEIIGSPHSINRHPDMPSQAFRALWKTITANKVWRGFVKNMAKDGSFYWALVYIQPKLDDEGNTIGYVAGRKVAFPKAIENAIQEYQELKEINMEDIVISDGYHTHITQR